MGALTELVTEMCAFSHDPGPKKKSDFSAHRVCCIFPWWKEASSVAWIRKNDRKIFKNKKLKIFFESEFDQKSSENFRKSRKFSMENQWKSKISKILKIENFLFSLISHRKFSRFSKNFWRFLSKFALEKLFLTFLFLNIFSIGLF